MEKGKEGKKIRAGEGKRGIATLRGKGEATQRTTSASVYYRFPKLISNSRGERGGWTARQEEREGGLEGPERELANRVRPGEVFHRMLGDP